MQNFPMQTKRGILKVTPDNELQVCMKSTHESNHKNATKT